MGGHFITNDPMVFERKHLLYLVYPFIANFAALFWIINYQNVLSVMKRQYFVIWMVFNCYTILIIKVSQSYFTSVKHMMIYTVDLSKFAYPVIRDFGFIISIFLVTVSVMIILGIEFFLSVFQILFLELTMASPCFVFIFSIDLQHI